MLLLTQNIVLCIEERRVPKALNVRKWRPCRALNAPTTPLATLPLATDALIDTAPIVPSHTGFNATGLLDKN
jgi:hypothetical protein